jgi:hypothetical protein
MIPISRGSSYISRDAKMVKNKTKLTRSILSFWWFCSWKVGLRMTFVQDYPTSSIRTGSDVIEPEVSQSEAPISETSSKMFEKKVTKRPILLYLQLIQNRKKHIGELNIHRKWTGSEWIFAILNRYIPE